MIEIKNLTMKYPNGRGVFNVDFSVGKGQVVGFLGPNGAGKTTTIRCLLGFMKSQEGTCTINGEECFVNAPKNCKNIGFIAGEPAFPDAMTGIEYLNFICDIRGIKDKTKMQQLLEYFELDARIRIKKMSKGMKQKTAIVAAFMHDPAVYILDEPSSGLDPLMQNKFINLLLTEKKRGKTILISSHIFEEIERTSDVVVIIKDGRIVVKDDVKSLKKGQRKVFIVASPELKKIKLSFETNSIPTGEIEVSVPFDSIDKFIKELAKYNITSVENKELSLESIFMQYYQAYEKKKGGVQ